MNLRFVKMKGGDVFKLPSYDTLMELKVFFPKMCKIERVGAIIKYRRVHQLNNPMLGPFPMY